MGTGLKVERIQPDSMSVKYRFKGGADVYFSADVETDGPVPADQSSSFHQGQGISGPPHPRRVERHARGHPGRSGCCAPACARRRCRGLDR
jgi:hypothetical protein